MKRFYQIEMKRWFIILMLIPFIVIPSYSQNHLSETDRAIEKLRKGNITVKAKPGKKVTVEQVHHDFWFGCTISNKLVTGEYAEDDLKNYKEFFLKNFNAASTANAIKWRQMEYEKGKVRFDIVDGILEWTEENKIPLRGQCIFWGIPRYIQPWVMELTDNELKQAIRERAEMIGARYKGRFAEYDLNNEMVHGNYYEDRLGPEITKWMAQWIHKEDPDAIFFVNDFDIATGEKLPEYMAQIRTLLKQGVPIAGIGVQGHSHQETFDRNELKRALDSLAVFNLPIRITELNIPGQPSKYFKDKELQLTDEEEKQKASELTDYYHICFAHPAVHAIMLWGFWEGDNWIPVSSLYKKDWTPTPAAEAYRDMVFRKWWTIESGITGKKGLFSTSAFYGEYKVTVGNDTKIIEFKPEQGSIIVDFTR